MGETKYTKFVRRVPEDIKDGVIENTKQLLSVLSEVMETLKEELEYADGKISPVLQKKYSDIYAILLEAKDGVDYMSESEVRDMNRDLRKILQSLFTLISGMYEDFQIREVQTPDGETERRIIQFKGERQTPESVSTALTELENIAKQKKISQIQVSKDLWKSQTFSVGDTLQYIKSEKIKENIRKLQKKGKLLAGTLEGLSGGTAYLKVFTIALAQTLNEQSKYYKTEKYWTGVPKEMIPEIMGEDVQIESKCQTPVKLNGESRQYPYILVSYEELAKKMSKTGKVSGGKDIEYIQDTIQTLSEKQYLYENRGVLIGIPFLVKEATIYTKGGEKEVGCLLRLSPHFSKSIGGYTGLRADTLQLLGGGKQKDITMDLFDLLVYNRGIPGGVYKVRKEDILSRYYNKDTYTQTKGGKFYIRKEKIETDFIEAVRKSREAKVIRAYKEEKSPGGEVLSVFTFSKKEYYSGEEIEDQTPK